ncbi:MAG TPA: hypothetical protein VLH56_07155, partial [Dissulfurispiraceae bacterium]|nr:hypothetical protein [Dissulfurispiraceae bacterium]
TLDAKCTAKNDSLRGSRIEKLGSIHVRTSPEIDPAEPQRDFFSSLLENRPALQLFALLLFLSFRSSA